MLWLTYATHLWHIYPLNETFNICLRFLNLTIFALETIRVGTYALGKTLLPSFLFSFLFGGGGGGQITQLVYVKATIISKKK